MALSWLQKFYRDNHINGYQGRLDKEGEEFWLNEAAHQGIDKTKTANKGEKLMAKTKPNKELIKGNTSVDLMKQEKELEYLLAEVKKQLIEKGWVQKDGVWGIE